jgi:hypothetical protein
MKSIFPSLVKPDAKNFAPLTSQASKHAAPGVPVSRIALEGDLSAISIDTIFQLFDFAALTGKLEVQSVTNRGTFYFRQGILIHGLLQINQRKIGEILLDSQVITEQQLQECLLLHKQTGTRRKLGHILVEKGYIKPDWLNNSLLHQVKEAFFEALSWRKGTFRFYPHQCPASDVAQLHARIDHLLLEGMVQIDQAASGEENEDE